MARWLARHVATKDVIVDLQEVSVRQCLREEEKRPFYVFVSRNATVDDVTAEFMLKPELETVIITASGSQSETPLGIITAWDIAHPS